MKLPNPKFVYDRRKRASGSKPGSVEIVIYHEGRTGYFNTGVSVLPLQWDGTGVRGRDDSRALNCVLADRMARINEAINILTIRGEEFSLEALKEEVSAPKAKANGNFIEYVEQTLKERKDIRESTRKGQYKLVSALKEFRGITGFCDLTARRIREFDRWLHSRGIKQSSVHGYHRIMKTYVTMAINEGYLRDTPYKGVKIGKGKPAERRYLNDEELQALAAVNVKDPTVMKARDLFLFQCYTGLAYVDLSLIDFEKFRGNEGKMILHEQRRKTGQTFHVVLLSPAVEILKRYDFKLPIITNQKYNVTLKAVSAFAGLDFSLTSHCGRHTFATWCLNQGVPLETLKTMMGHADIKTTQEYAKILNRTVEDTFEWLETKV